MIRGLTFITQIGMKLRESRPISQPQPNPNDNVDTLLPDVRCLDGHTHAFLQSARIYFAIGAKEDKRENRIEALKNYAEAIEALDDVVISLKNEVSNIKKGMTRDLEAVIRAVCFFVFLFV